MKVVLKDRTIIVTWIHTNPAKTDLRSTSVDKYGTTCKILQEEPGKKINELKVLASGKSFLHEKDLTSFDRAKGRFHSFRRALYVFSPYRPDVPKSGGWVGNDDIFTKEDRKIIWTSYRYDRH